MGINDQLVVTIAVDAVNALAIWFLFSFGKDSRKNFRNHIAKGLDKGDNYFL